MRRTSAALTAVSVLVVASATLDAEDTAKFGAVVQAGVTRADTPARNITSAIVKLDIETRHADIGRGWDFALAVDAGRQPLFAMVKTAPAAALMRAYLNGLTTGAGFRIGRATTTTETAIVGRLGTARIDSADAMPASNDIGAWSAFFDGHVDFRWYGRDVRVVHLEATTLAPIVEVYAGLKHDQRFHRAGDLAGFRDPTGRVALGASAYPIRVVWLNVGGGVDFEGALPGTDRLPSGFRAVLAGRLDLRRALHVRKEAWADAYRHTPHGKLE
jgi:hypothetical protein